jgi:hypothetical protein
MAFVKLHDQLLRSSIIEEDLVVRWVWICLLLSCDRNGNIYGTDQALARKANVTLDEFRSAMKTLQSPDPDSTSDEEDGRRVVWVSNNLYHCVNYKHYRGLKDPDEQREAWRERKRRQRQNVPDVPEMSRNVPKTHTIAEAEAEAEAYTEHHSPSGDGRRGSIPFDEFWKLYPRRDAKKRARSAWMNLTVKNQRAAIDALPHHVQFWIADGRTRKTTPLPTTWINGERWNDELDSVDDPGGDDGGEWVYDTYRRSDLAEHGENELWQTYCNVAAGLDPRTAPTFDEWMERGVQ